MNRYEDLRVYQKALDLVAAVDGTAPIRTDADEVASMLGGPCAPSVLDRLPTTGDRLR